MSFLIDEISRKDVIVKIFSPGSVLWKDCFIKDGYFQHNQLGLYSIEEYLLFIIFHQ